MPQTVEGREGGRGRGGKDRRERWREERERPAGEYVHVIVGEREKRHLQQNDW